MAPLYGDKSGHHAGQRPLWWSTHLGQSSTTELGQSPQLPRMPPEHFVLFGKARSGTTWLLSMLRAHPEITAHGEILLGHNASDAIKNTLPQFLESGCQPTSRACGFKWISGQLFSFKPIPSISNIPAPPVEDPWHTALPAMAADLVHLTAIGAHDNLTTAEGLQAQTPHRPTAEHHWHSTASEWFCEWLLLHRFKVIMLEREGLERLVSKIKLDQTHVWRCTDANCSAAAAAYKVTVNATTIASAFPGLTTTTVVGALDKSANDWDIMRRTLRQRFPSNQLLHLTYHDLAASPRHQMERIVSFLGVEPRQLSDLDNMSSPVKKMGEGQGSFKPTMVVSNPPDTAVYSAFGSRRL